VTCSHNWPRNQREKSPAEEKPISSATSYNRHMQQDQVTDIFKP
jgi:hypothetical protein